MLARMQQTAITMRVVENMHQIDAACWNTLLARQAQPTPFMRHAYLAALHDSASAAPESGWHCRAMTLWQGAHLMAACPLYVKTHSWGEYVFDHAWAQAYQHHGVAYYPKGVVALPFTPVAGTRLMAHSPAWRARLLRALRMWAKHQGLSSLHLLFGDAQDVAACRQDGWLVRHGAVQFQWRNRSGEKGRWHDFDDFLADLSQDKRKKIRQERRRVAQAGVRFRALHGRAITRADWDFFCHCYARTYWEHGNAPYLTPAFFHAMAQHMPQHWLMFVAERAGERIASSLIAVDANKEINTNIFDIENNCSFVPSATLNNLAGASAYGRYWGALQRVDCLHFEACYYQPIAWCIAHGLDFFDGGVQGAHKSARALLAHAAQSAHWVAHPAFARAIAGFVQAEAAQVQDHVQYLHAHGALREKKSAIAF